MPEEIIINNKFLDRLEYLADHATKGPWICTENGDYGYNIYNKKEPGYVVFSGSDEEGDYGIEREEDAEYIAALSPDVVKAWIRRFRLINKEAEILAMKIVGSNYLTAGYVGSCRGEVRLLRYQTRELARKELENGRNRETSRTDSKSEN